MADPVRIKPVIPDGDRSELEKASKFLCPINEREYTLCVEKSAVLLSFDGLETETFNVERFFGCGHGDGGTPVFMCGKPLTMSATNPLHVFTLPGRYRIEIEGPDPIDVANVHVEEMDVPFELAQLYIQQCACCLPEPNVNEFHIGASAPDKDKGYKAWFNTLDGCFYVCDGQGNWLSPTLEVTQ